MSCDWPIDRTCLPALPVLPDSPTDDEQAAYDLALATRNAAEDLAVYTLWALSGRQFGVCETVVRPCPPPQILGMNSLRWRYYTTFEIVGWENPWYLTGCNCGMSCRLSGPRSLHLPGPVFPPDDDHPIEVEIAGVIQDPNTFQLEGDVFYTDAATWPMQDLGLPLGEQFTWSVTYWRGQTPPPGTSVFVGTLAKEFYLACSGKPCRLPRNVTRVQRQGVSYETYNVQDIYKNGKTGIPEIDLWLASVNPGKLMQPPVVL